MTTVDPPVRWHGCQWCHRPIRAAHDWWLDQDDHTVCTPDQWHDGVFPRDIWDEPMEALGGQSYREAVFATAPSRHIMPWANRPPCLPHTPLGTWWWERWGPEPQYILENRRLVCEVLEQHGLTVVDGRYGVGDQPPVA